MIRKSILNRKWTRYQDLQLHTFIINLSKIKSTVSKQNIKKTLWQYDALAKIFYSLN
jgi:hypothetical protein